MVETQVREKPILFSGSMVRAILDGKKTQTRRVIKPQPSSVEFWLHGEPSNSRDGLPTLRDSDGHGWAMCGPFACPFGVPGDRLWVRETFAGGAIRVPGAIDYRADGLDYGDIRPTWRPSIFMPRWASRISLEILKVRVERVQDISEADAIAEGCEREFAPDGSEYGAGLTTATEKYATLWDSINAKRGYSWESNPWTWVIEFKPVTGRANP